MNSNPETKNKKNPPKKSSEKILETKSKNHKDGTQYNFFKIALKIPF
jgi:hypothetical protein